MTKIVLSSETAAPVFEVLKTPLSVLLHPTIVAYHESQGVIYVADSYAELTTSRLTEAGIPIEVVRSDRFAAA
jgi:hypothetical protein